MNYYNEHDPFAAAWLRKLIREGAIPAGLVDERDVRDVVPSELDGYDQCHFFAGIGGWCEALRLAGMSDVKGLFSGSCPCQPFSAAGRRGGFADERHLWPAFFHLVEQCRPALVVGEQVSGAAGLRWLDLVCDDLEGCGYAVRAEARPACSVGAPHRRERLWWSAYDASRGREQGCASGLSAGDARNGSGDHGGTLGLALTERGGRQGRNADWRGSGAALPSGEGIGELGDADRQGLGQRAERDGQPDAGRELQQRADAGGSGHWSDVVWRPCRDGKCRPTQPGLQSLAHGVPNRVGTLRGAGNAIVPQVGAEFLRSALDDLARSQ